MDILQVLVALMPLGGIVLIMSLVLADWKEVGFSEFTGLGFFLSFMFGVLFIGIITA